MEPVTPEPPRPDDKDWTWVLDRPCGECGFDAASVAREELGPLLVETAPSYMLALAGPGATSRPSPQVWSVLEYCCHVRDVHRTFAERVRLMVSAVDPQFPNWDQDATALESAYHLQDPAVVGPELVSAAAEVAQVYDGVQDWSRRGFRSNGSVFTVESIGRYHLHDVVHHLWDITRG